MEKHVKYQVFLKSGNVLEIHNEEVFLGIEKHINGLTDSRSYKIKAYSHITRDGKTQAIIDLFSIEAIIAVPSQDVKSSKDNT
jgi:hypothetical protein